MGKAAFEYAVGALGAAFTLAFALLVAPPALSSGDVLGAFAAGFVNPYSTGYALDAILCGLILIVWMLHERSTRKIKHGWVVIPLSFAPGVATALAVYLVLRSRQLSQQD